MLLKLYLLGAALALMPLPIQPQPYHRKFFPELPEDITKITFPVYLNTSTTSDIVILKCPHVKYKHNKQSISFSPEYELSISQIKELKFQNDALIWTPSMRKSSNKVQYNCGTIRYKVDNGEDKYREWTYNIMWKKGSTLPKSAESRYTKADLIKKHDKCNNSQEKALILTKNKENDMIVKANPSKLENPYVNQIFHYFITPKQEDTYLIREPCAVVKIYFDCPDITLKDYPFTDQDLLNDTAVIKINGNEEIIQVILKVEEDTSYFRDEVIYLKKMKYRKDGSEVIENTNISIISNFTIKGYDLVELTYECPSGGNISVITQKFYFAPRVKDLKLPGKTLKYGANDTFLKLNCPTAYLTIGYLEEVIYNEIRGNVSILSSIDGIKGKFKKIDSNIIFDEAENGTTTISCIYKTLDGHITTTTDFVNMDKIVGPDINEKQVAKDKIVLISSLTTTISPNTVKKEVKGEENNSIRRSRTLVEAFMLFLLLLLQW
uniref:Ig-like domain-containing protein n=1 Tax=Strongyloides papillosus TaxID=174720 RepID=A0A0N5B4B8_STREA